MSPSLLEASRGVLLQWFRNCILHMDIQDNDLQFIKRALLINNAVLFTGAGFSLDATNIQDKPMPTGNGLSDQLWDYIGYPGKRTNETLKALYEAALHRPHDALRVLLRSNFECRSYAAWYRLVATFYWYRIYSTNIDNVLELVYRDVKQVRLDTIDGLNADCSERDQFLASIQYIKINGKDWNRPKEITFGFRQYARRATDAPSWYEQLARDFVTRVVIFVGTEIDEPLFWNAIELRGKKFGEGEKRLKSFWIKPHFSPVEMENLKQFNVIALPGNAKEFFELIYAKTADERDRTKVLRAAQPMFHKLEEAIIGEMNAPALRDLQIFYSAFSPVIIPEKVPSTRKSFLLGAAPDWPAIHNNLDADRVCTGELKGLIDNGLKDPKLRVISVCGHAGAGKSTVLMRLAVSLRSEGHLVVWTDSETSVPVHVFKNVLGMLGSRPIFIIDNALRIRGPLIDYLVECRMMAKAPLFVIADRTNRNYSFEAYLIGEFKAEKYGIPNLAENDIVALIETLDRNGLLGRLSGLARERQIYQFSIRAGKQLLVAMREATNGRDFDEIIFGEFDSLPTDEVKVIYASVCLATSAGYSLTPQQFIALSDLEPNETLNLLESTLREVVVSVSMGRTGLIARHRVIAALIVDRLCLRELLEKAYTRILAVLSKDLEHPVRTSSRTFRMYREIINHERIWYRFPQSINQARSIYEGVKAHFTNDSHFWLQYGSLELQYGELELAEVYLSASEALAPKDEFVQNTKGFLCYKRAVASTRVMEAQELRDQAREILYAQCGRHPMDVYAPHILYSQELAYIRTWITKPDDRKKYMERLRAEIDECVKTHSFSERLTDLKKEIHDAYLELALG